MKDDLECFNACSKLNCEFFVLNSIPEFDPLGGQSLDPKVNSDQDIATAYHEAGHAVVALSLGRTIVKLSIVRNSLRLGAVNLGSGRTGRRQDYFETEALILLAGIVCEARITGELNWSGARQDLSILRRHISTRVSSEKAANRLERRLFDKAEHYVTQPNIWEAIERIATMLIQHRSISGRSARHIYDEATKND
jgi:ATP-dependent Zn protease